MTLNDRAPDEPKDYAEPRAPWKCFDCAQSVGDYWARAETWAAAWPEYEAHRKSLVDRLYPRTLDPAERSQRMFKEGRHVLLLCLPCLAHRLGRPLTPGDFDLNLPPNYGIRAGIEMGRRFSISDEI